jgi:hypothetical protein
MPFGEAGVRQDGSARSRTARGLIRTWDTQSLEEHVALMKRQVDRSCADPETLQLARKITSGKPDSWQTFKGERWPIVEAWGEGFILPSAGSRCAMRDSKCELDNIWDFAVANVRYVYDPPDYDLFCTAEYTLKAGAADCDDFTILFAALQKCCGFGGVAARVVTQSGKSWEHVYDMCALEKENPQTWVAFDPTVEGVEAGWQFDGVKDYRDFYL